MTLRPIDHLLKSMLGNAAWEHQRRFQTITQLWQELLPEKSKANSRPHSIQDDVLLVATPNTTWSQHLNLQRLRILKRLNARLTEQPITDIRFSAAHWNQTPAYSPLADPNLEHPSKGKAVPKQSAEAIAESPTAAVQNWFEKKQVRLQNNPPCPQCGVPTPEGELKRWQMCSCCIAQRWNKNN